MILKINSLVGLLNKHYLLQSSRSFSSTPTLSSDLTKAELRAACSVHSSSPKTNNNAGCNVKSYDEAIRIASTFERSVESWNWRLLAIGRSFWRWPSSPKKMPVPMTTTTKKKWPFTWRYCCDTASTLPTKCLLRRATRRGGRLLRMDGSGRHPWGVIMEGLHLVVLPWRGGLLLCRFECFRASEGVFVFS